MLVTEALSFGSRVKSVSIELRGGEVLGLAGLMGSGRTELASLLAGIHAPSSGSMTLAGEPYAPRSIKQAMQSGVAYVSEDRKNEGLLLTMSVADNINLPTLWHQSLGGLLRANRLRDLAATWIERLNVKTPHQKVSVNLLSGGNQQKVALAKSLSTKPTVVLLDEPTRGVDVGAKAEIHDLIRRIASDGAAVLVVSSDLPEILAVSDRIAVMSQGRITGVVPTEDATEESVLQLAFESVDA
jgi:ribose transport system ATP-binding protein